MSCAAASKVRACSEEGEQQRQICLSMLVPSTLCPFPQRGGAELFLGGPAEPEADAQAVVSISESRAEAILAHRPPKNTHRSQRKSISLQTEHPLLRCRHLHWGSASAAVCRRGCAPSSAPEINTQTWATAAFIIAARFICWLSHLQALRQNISSQHGEEQRVDAFVSVLLER